MKQFILALCALILFTSAALAQQTAVTSDGKKVVLNADGTWKFAEPTSGVTLKIEAGIVYKTGDPQPVARATFYLLENDPLPEIQKLPTTAFGRGIFKTGGDEFMLRCGEGMPEALAIIKRYIRYDCTTGFDGKAEISEIKPGKYWLFGRTETRPRYRCEYWLMPLDLTKNQTVTLDQHNAAQGR